MKKSYSIQLNHSKTNSNLHIKLINTNKLQLKKNRLMISNDLSSKHTINTSCIFRTRQSAILCSMHTKMFFILFGLFLCILFVRCQLQSEQIKDETQNWPQPPSWPIVGHLPLVWQLTHGNQFKRALNLLQQYGAEHRLQLWLGPKLYFFNCNPKDMQAILNAPELLEKSDDYAAFKSWLCDGLLASNVEKWKRHRKMLAPAFNYGMLRKFISIFETQACTMVQGLKLYAERDQPLDIFMSASLCTLDIICETTLGVSINAQLEKKSPYIDAVHAIQKIIKQRLENIFYRPDAIYKYTKLAQEEKRVLQILHGFSTRIIQRRRREMTLPDLPIDADDFGNGHKLSYLDILLQTRVNGIPLTEDAIREEVDNIIFGGFDTTATTIKFFIYNMAKHKEWQQKCRDEILEVCGSEKIKISSECLRQLNCVEMCIKETLRLYPPAPLVGRKATADCVINGYCIPSGSNLYVSPLYAGRCEELFPHAYKFKPERFLRDAIPKVEPTTFLPFMLGPRSCLGQKYAMLMMKMIIAQLLRNFEFDHVNNNQNADAELSFVLTLQTKHPLMFKVKAI